MCCALHLLMFCFFLTYVKLTIPKRRVTTLPFPAWDARKYWSKIPFTPLVDTPHQEHWTHLRPTLSWNPSLSGTGLTTSLWRAACFPDVNVAVLFAPSHPAPLAQSSSSNAETSLSSAFGAVLVLSSLPVPPRADITRGLPLMPPASRTHAQRGKMQRLFRRVRDCLGCTAFELPKDEHTDRTFVAIHTTTYW